MHRLQVSTEVPQPLIIVDGKSSIVSNLVFPGWFIGRFILFASPTKWRRMYAEGSISTTWINDLRNSAELAHSLLPIFKSAHSRENRS